MAGAGRKTFSAGSVLTASDVMNYLQDQAVMVFGGTAARSSAIPSPSEGMVTYRTDDNALEYYDGASWTSALNPTVNAQTGTTYTFVASDNGKLVTASNSSSQTFTIPPQSSVAWPDGTILSVISYGTGTVTFAGGVGVTVTNTANTLSQYQGASLIRTASNAWTVVPLSGGVNPLADATVTGTTGSPSTATYTSGGINYKTYTWTGSGSITFNKSGLVDILVVGGGGSSGLYTTDRCGGGGAGGYLRENDVYIKSGTATVTIGAGGGTYNTITERRGNTGFPSSISQNSQDLYVALGGAGGTGNGNGMYGGSGGGGAGNDTTAAGVAALPNQGKNGGGGVANAAGGGGGAGAVGANGAGTAGGNGGAGASTDIRAGSPVTYAGGGGGSGSGSAGTGGAGGGGNGAISGASQNGTANTGGGAGSSGSGGGFASGGSGIVVIRVRA